ncbi:hypothetical protein PoB_003727400 [Plakobranchus ocellatus]|uniref:Uncharacterized protein n=1 Tax=Plakobranchus ocellatus TaxID=259542 RepID=A0AAV4AXB0_9GAST|nr:hypothetical protein PoB_003727400 [Plakobranchus ocellatus]
MGSLSEKIDVYGSTDETHSAAPVGAIVRVDGREKHLVVTETEVTISPCKTSSTDITDLSVSITDVIGVQMDFAPKSKGRADNSALSETVCMILHYTQHRVKDKTLRPKKVKVWGNRAYLTELGQKIRDFCYKGELLSKSVDCV